MTKGDLDAYNLLEKLLTSGEKSHAGVRKRESVLTATHLRDYWESPSSKQRENFEAVLEAAAANGAITLERESGYADDGVIRRVKLTDLDQLANFLSRQTQQNKLNDAHIQLDDAQASYPVLMDVFAQWSKLKKVRGIGPEGAPDWVDAIRVIEHMKSRHDVSEAELPVREVSAKLFRDSKRIERLVSLIDVLVSGDIAPEQRRPNEILAEIGLGREEMPVRLAGNVCVRRSRVCSILDAPYGAFPASSIVGLEGNIVGIRTIENQTTFHRLALRESDLPRLLIYTGGMPSPAWVAMYKRILSSVSPPLVVDHWGDVDEGGFRIAAFLARAAQSEGHILKPYRMQPSEVPEAVRRKAPEHVVDHMIHYAGEAGWPEIADEIRRMKIVVEQEALD
jgi:hypothetical protein